MLYLKYSKETIMNFSKTTLRELFVMRQSYKSIVQNHREHHYANITKCNKMLESIDAELNNRLKNCLLVG